MFLPPCDIHIAESEILTIFLYFLAASAAKNCEKKAVIKSAASAASAKGGCASSRLDHGLKFHVIPGGCASSRLISELSDCDKPTYVDFPPVLHGSQILQITMALQKRRTLEIRLFSPGR